MRPILMKGHERPLTFLKYNRDGDLLFSCAKDHNPTVWFADNGERLGTYRGHNGAVWSCDVSRDSAMLITGSADQTAKIWNVKTGTPVYTFNFDSPTRSVDLAVGDKLAVITTDPFMGLTSAIHIKQIARDPDDRETSQCYPHVYGDDRLGHELPNTQAAIRWATDYLLKCARATPGKLYVGVGDPNADHKCWERPEDMDTVRSVYSVSPSNPGSDVAGETAAALAAASIVFRKVDRDYSKLLLRTAKSVFQFAMQNRGSYSDSLGSAVCPFYCSYSGYTDELLWGATWLFRATNDIYYLNFITSLGANDNTDIFSWDNKYAGARVLLARRTLVNNDQAFQPFRQQAEDFMCRILPNSPYSTTQYTPGGLMFKLSGSNLQYVTSISFLLTTYSKYMATSKHTFNCGNLLVTSRTLRILAKKQVDYILGDNPMKMSYMVGYGSNYPRRIHHRGSSLPSLTAHPQSLGCEAGFQPFYYTPNPNPNILTGAIVGGPNQNDFFPDERTDYSHSEPATYINAAIVGPLAYFAGTN